MKRTLAAAILALLVVLALPATTTAVTYTASADSTYTPSRYVHSASQTLTQAAPNSDTDGILVPPHVVGCTIGAQAQAGATLTNLVLTPYLFDPVMGLWGKMNLINLVPQVNGSAAAVGTINVTSISDRTWSTVLPSQFVTSLPRGSKLDFVSTGSTVSAGTAITVFISCW